MPISYTSDLQAYIDFATDKIDQAALQSRLDNHSVVEDSATHAAKRRLQVASRLIESGELEQASVELDAAAKLSPNEPSLLLVRTNLLIATGKAAEALELIDRVAPDAAPTWQIQLLKGRCLIALQKFDEAKRVLPESLKLNPNPAEAHYLVGIAYQNTNEFQKAAEEFRAACESATSGQKLVMPRSTSK